MLVDSARWPNAVTIAKLIDRAMRLEAHCHRCGRCAVLDPADLHSGSTRLANPEMAQKLATRFAREIESGARLPMSLLRRSRLDRADTAPFGSKQSAFRRQIAVRMLSPRLAGKANLSVASAQVAAGQSGAGLGSFVELSSAVVPRRGALLARD